VCYWFASQGLVAINVEYRLADVAPFPGGADDVRDALALVRSESERLGINRKRLFLIGHSAGGTHAATYLFDPIFSGSDRSGIAGAVLISARLAADVRVGNPNANPVRTYFGQDEALYAQRSPLTYAESCNVPLLIAIAEFENPYLDAYGTEFFLRALKHRTSAPRFIQMRGHNHTSIVAHFNSGEDYLGREILSFIKAI
jgi:acetyl esterase